MFLHAFGARYDLPISLALYLYAAAGVVVISFVMVTIFAGDRIGDRAVQYPRRRLAWLEGLGASRGLRAVTGTIGVAVLAAIIITGLFGSTQPARNPAEYLTWIYFWAGLVLVSGLLGNLWSLFNPFAAIYDALVRRPRGGARRLPAALGIWPAVLAYFCFACLELTTGLANRPWLVATTALLYTAVNLIGMAVFGRDEWLYRCEAFTVLFDIIGRFSPVETEAGQVYLRPWGTGLLRPMRAGWDRVVFVILMLSTLAFDGVIATPLWQNLAADLVPYWQPYGQFGFFALRTFGLVDLTLLFLVVFVTFMRLVMYFGTVKVDAIATMTAFALTLVPIALVYNAAHNYSYLLVQSQALIPLLADPLGRGWHLLPTADYQPNFALAGAATVWYMQVVLIVLGHVVAVYLAHLRAGERFRNAKNVLLSQYPMLLLMVLYTMTSLWILAQPITRETG